MGMAAGALSPSIDCFYMLWMLPVWTLQSLWYFWPDQTLWWELYIDLEFAQLFSNVIIVVIFCFFSWDVFNMSFKNNFLMKWNMYKRIGSRFHNWIIRGNLEWSSWWKKQIFSNINYSLCSVLFVCLTVSSRMLFVCLFVCLFFHLVFVFID